MVTDPFNAPLVPNILAEIGIIVFLMYERWAFLAMPGYEEPQ
jgi:hypothetical protein